MTRILDLRGGKHQRYGWKDKMGSDCEKPFLPHLDV